MSKILIIDDDLDFGDLTQRRLSRMGFEVKLHAGAHGAMDPLLRDGFDLVILDVKMPGLDGTEVIKMIRTLRTGHLSVLFYSSSDTTELRRLADAHGAQGYLTKTATMAELEFRVRALLGESSRAPRRDLTR
jgi:DNA-binding response OmpR family regulator